MGVALAVGTFPGMMVLGFGLEYFFGPNSLEGLGSGIGAVGLIVTSVLLGVGFAMVYGRS